MRDRTSRSSGNRTLSIAFGAVWVLLAAGITLSGCAANPHGQTLRSGDRDGEGKGDKVVIRTDAGKCTIDVNGERLGTYDAPEVKGQREVVIDASSDGTTTVTVDGVPVVKAKE